MLIDSFNEACNNIAASYLKVRDKSMSVIIFHMTTKGNLPHLSYIFRKPWPLGTEFKKVDCYVTGALLLFELQRGKQVMNHIKYQHDIISTTNCTNRMTKATKGIGQKYRKYTTNHFFIFDSWFSSKKLFRICNGIWCQIYWYC